MDRLTAEQVGELASRYTAWMANPVLAKPAAEFLSMLLDNLPSLLATAKREAEHVQEIHDLAWNLAGCDMIATSGKPQEFSAELARPALVAVNDMAKKVAEQAAEIERLNARVRELGKEPESRPEPSSSDLLSQIPSRKEKA